jgi:membrane-associated phospholipid phosphatase
LCKNFSTLFLAWFLYFPYFYSFLVFSTWRFLPLLICFGGAGFVALTRTRDYYHNFDDIIAGAIIGTSKWMSEWVNECVNE